MVLGAWRATVHGVAESDTTEHAEREINRALSPGVHRSRAGDGNGLPARLRGGGGGMLCHL